MTVTYTEPTVENTSGHVNVLDDVSITQFCAFELHVLEFVTQSRNISDDGPVMAACDNGRFTLSTTTAWAAVTVKTTQVPVLMPVVVDAVVVAYNIAACC